MLVTDKQIAMEKRLKEKVDIMCERCTKHKFDNLLLIDGDEGHGKTTCGINIAYYVSYVTGRPFSIDNVFFDVDKMIEFAVKNEKQIIFWDEAVLGGLAMESYNRVQTKLLKLLMIARKKQHFYFFLIPKFYRLREAIIDRAVGLVHVYARNETQRGRFVYFKKKNKEALYGYWRSTKKKGYKQFFNFTGSFSDRLADIIDEAEYDRRKDNAILSIMGSGETKNAQVEKLKAELDRMKGLYAQVKGITQKDLAKIGGISTKSLQRWKNEQKKTTMPIEKDKDIGTDYTILGVSKGDVDDDAYNSEEGEPND